MDYPHPFVRLYAQGEIDLSNAYDLKIGEWDKIAIKWGYAHFPAGTDEPATLKLLRWQGQSSRLRVAAAWGCQNKSTRRTMINKLNV